MNYAEATWALLKEDRVNDPGKNEGLDTVQNVAIGVHNVASNIGNILTSPLDKNDYYVENRTGIFDATAAGLDQAWHAKWFNGKGLLPAIGNVGAKVATLIMNIDKPINDALHLGGKGKVIKVRGR